MGDPLCLLAVLFLSTLCLSLLSFSLLVLYTRFKYRGLPGPPPTSFFLGHLPELKSLKQKKVFHHNLFLDWARKYGPVYKIFFLHKCLIIVTGSSIIKEILSKSKYRKAKLVYRRLYSVCGARFLGNGFVTNLDHQEWIRRRSCVNPAFHKKFLCNNMTKFNEVADEWIETLTDLSYNQTPFEMVDMLSRVTLDMLWKVAFNMEMQDVENRDNSFSSQLLKVLHGMDVTVRDPLFKFKPSNAREVKEICKAVSYIRQVCKQQIQIRINEQNSGCISEDTDVLGFMLKEKDVVPHLTLDDLVDDFVTLVIAGQETTANALSFLFGEIGRNSGVLARLLTEVDEIIGKESFISYHHIGQLSFMDQVLKETLRLYPVAPATVREVQHETTIDGVQFPANSNVIIPFYVIHRMPDYYENPLSFDPNRFHPDKKRPFFTYMPFSLGRRSCAGQQFAQIEAKVLLCKFLQNFSFKLSPNQSFEVYESTTLRPRGGIQMTLTKR